MSYADEVAAYAAYHNALRAVESNFERFDTLEDWERVCKTLREDCAKAKAAMEREWLELIPVAS